MILVRGEKMTREARDQEYYIGFGEKSSWRFSRAL